MTFYTRTDESGIVVWSRYCEKPADLAPGEVECTEADYKAGHAQMWTAKPASETPPSTAPVEGGHADKPA